MSKNRKSFYAINNLELVIINRRSAVNFEVGSSNEGENSKDKFSFKFSPEVFEELLRHIEEVSNKSWADINPREADSLGSDYSEYYDKTFDNNGYLSIKDKTLDIERPSLESSKLYQFNKRRMESFIYDLRKMNYS